MSGIEEFLERARAGSVGSFYFVSHASADNPQIKPVLEVLIEAGVPLWIDKPRDIGFEPAQFIGCLQHGETWSSQLKGAIGLARGLIYFPSTAYTASRECAHEIGVAEYLKLERGVEFDIVPVFSVEGAFEETDPRTAMIQGTAAFVSNTESGYALTSEYELGVADLANHLIERIQTPIRYREQQLALARGFRLSDENKEKMPAQSMRDYSVPYRVNRNSQRDAVRDAYSLLYEDVSRRRPIFVCHGDNTDETRWFVSTTIGERLLSSRKLSKCFNWAECSKSAIMATLPTCDLSDTPKFNRQFRDNLIEKYPGASEPSSRMSAIEGLAQSFSNDHSTRIVSSRLETAPPEANCKSLKDVLEHVEAWARFWDKFPFESADHDAAMTIVPVFELVYDTKTQGGGLFSRGPVSKQVNKFLQTQAQVSAFVGQFANVEVIFLNRLDKISPSWAGDWVDDDTDLFGMLSLTEKQNVRTALKKQFGDRSNLPMRDWSEVAKPVLQESQIGFRRT